MDIADVKMEVYDASEAYKNATASARGYVILPESDMKKVIIPSPPSVRMLPTNPRPVYIYLTGEAITPESAAADALKAYARENKVVFVCPGSKDLNDLVAAGLYVVAKASRLNIVKNEISVKADEASLDLANSLVEALDEEDVECEDAEVFSL